MITKFNKYNLILEKSTLSKYFNNSDLKFLYKNIKLNHENKIVELDFNEPLKVQNYLRADNTCVIIKDNDTTCIFYHNGNDIYLYFKDSNTNNNNNYHISALGNLIKRVFNSMNLVDVKVYEVELQPKIDVRDKVFKDKVYHIDLLFNTIELYYGNLFKNFYTEYFKMIKQLKIENIDVVEELNTDEYQFYKQLDRDFNISLNLKTDYLFFVKDNLSLYDRQAKLKELLFKIYGKGEYDELEHSLSNYYKYIKNNTYFVASKIAKLIFLENNSKLYIYRNKYYDILLEKDPSKWSKFKLEIFDKKLKDKWKHLDNANKFDLI